MLQAVKVGSGTGRRAPSLRDDAAYAAALDKANELSAQLAGRERRKDELLGALRDTRRDDVTVRAEQLLARGAAGESEEAALTQVRTELERVLDEVRILRKAIELHRPRVESERWRASREVDARARPAHMAIGRRMLGVLEELGAVVAEEREFLEELAAGDVSLVTIRPASVNRVGRLEDPHSLLSSWARELRDYVEGR